MEFLDSLSLSTIVWSLIAILEIVVRITPSDKDNSILNKIVWVILGPKNVYLFFLRTLVQLNKSEFNTNGLTGISSFQRNEGGAQSAKFSLTHLRPRRFSLIGSESDVLAPGSIEFSRLPICKQTVTICEIRPRLQRRVRDGF